MQQNSIHLAIVSLLLIAFLPVQAQESALPAIADVHLHYNGDQESVVSPEEAITLLKQQNIKLAVVSSTPPELALALAKAGGDWVIPLFRPYFNSRQRYHWFNDPDVLPLARKALQSGKFKGIGELHLIAGIGPGRKNAALNGLIKLGIEFDLPLLIHIETSSHLFFQPLCKQYPKARFLLAHAGGLLDHNNIGELMKACPNVWVEFSARDPWRYVQSPIVDKNGSLLPGWRSLIKRYPSRFMIGSDPYWPVEKELALEEPDSGWLHIKDYLDFHRKWLANLPTPLRKQIRIDNAHKFFMSNIE
jgi:Amidohydrolase